MKIVQLGCFNRNIGDSIALMNPRRSIQNLQPPSMQFNVGWSDLCLADHFHKVKNNIEISKKYFQCASDQADYLFVGGAGLIEGSDTFATGWKLPFNEEILEEIKIPIIVFAVGLNFHRRYPRFDLSEEGFNNLCLLIEKSAYFSVRNDGSYEKLKELFDMYGGKKSLFKKVKEIPDAGLIFPLDEQNKRLPRISHGNSIKVFNPTWSPKPLIRNNSRRLHFLYENPSVKSRIVKQYYFFPHTSKDLTRTISRRSIASFMYKSLKKRPALFKEFIDTSNIYQSLGHYDNMHLMFGLHAHAQLISIGKNIPCISYSSVDKIGDFVKKYDLEEFDIDPEEKTHREVAEEFLEIDDKFTHDVSFLNSWYDKRDKLVSKFHKQYNKAIKEVCNILK